MSTPRGESSVKHSASTQHSSCFKRLFAVEMYLEVIRAIEIQLTFPWPANQILSGDLCRKYARFFSLLLQLKMTLIVLQNGDFLSFFFAFYLFKIHAVMLTN